MARISNASCEALRAAFVYEMRYENKTALPSLQSDMDACVNLLSGWSGQSFGFSV